MGRPVRARRHDDRELPRHPRRRRHHRFTIARSDVARSQTDRRYRHAANAAAQAAASAFPVWSALGPNARRAALSKAAAALEGKADLFVDAVWVVATDEGVDADVWSQVADLALDCGSVVVPAESLEHDRAVARISHLPHLLAETLAITGAAGGELALGLAAGSFRDGTRVAGSAPGLVRAMCEGNRDALLVALDEALDLLQGARTDLLDNGSTARLVDAGFAARGAYESHERWDIEDVQAGEPDWINRMRDAGRRGGVIRRSAT